ncbi:MAG TPA: DUF389 domain-containing protein, partial [Anaerolineales bacterium]|nr:DUF389 domain-containing protein [Anaerolineales bacterium]
ARELRRRRRRRGQLRVPQDAEGRAALLEALARRAYPTYELFVFAALSGAILALGYLLDSQALLLFGALVAPLLLPWVGLLLGVVTGSGRFFFETFVALLISALLVFGSGFLGGVAAGILPPRAFEQAIVHSRLWWPDLVILALGAVILTASFVRSESKPFLPSVILAYEFFLPLAAGGLGLGAGLPNLWPHGVLVFFVHLAWAGLFALLTLLALNFRPKGAPALLFTSAVSMLALAVLAVLMSAGTGAPPFRFTSNISTLLPATIQLPGSPRSLPAPPTSAAPTQASPTFAQPTVTQVPPTPGPTRLPTHTPTIASTVEPTPIYAQISAPRDGAVLRASPGGEGLTTLDNFSYVEILPETEVFSGYTWVHVVALINGNRVEGWIVQPYLITPTAAPGTAPDSSATGTVTP